MLLESQVIHPRWHTPYVPRAYWPNVCSIFAHSGICAPQSLSACIPLLWGSITTNTWQLHSSQKRPCSILYCVWLHLDLARALHNVYRLNLRLENVWSDRLGCSLYLRAAFNIVTALWSQTNTTYSVIIHRQDLATPLDFISSC